MATNRVNRYLLVNRIAPQSSPVECTFAAVPVALGGRSPAGQAEVYQAAYTEARKQIALRRRLMATGNDATKLN